MMLSKMAQKQKAVAVQYKAQSCYRALLMTENKGEKFFRASCSFSTALQPLWRYSMLPDTGFGSVTAVMTNCSAST